MPVSAVPVVPGPISSASKIRLESPRLALLWLAGFSGALVFIEPSPYELVVMLAMVAFAATGLTLRPALVPLLVVLILYNIGFSFAVMPLVAESKRWMWVLVSWFMSTTALFYAAMLGINTAQRLDTLMRGYTAAAVAASALGILAYFHILGGWSDALLKYGRIRATFNDPNVLGAFLILPALLSFQRVFRGGAGDAIRAMISFGVLTLAVLLCFSRAAWGQLAAGSVVLLLLMLLVGRSTRERTRIILIGGAGFAVLALLIAALLALPTVGSLFAERASLDQYYDTGHNGRFSRHVLGMLLALDKPLGIGPLEFAKIFPEDPHNAYLNAFMSGGWLSGCAYLTLVALTVIVGFRAVFMRTPWQSIYLPVYTAFLCTAAESFVIDSDHWRHYFLILGSVWGLVAASKAYVRNPENQAATFQHRSPLTLG